MSTLTSTQSRTVSWTCTKCTAYCIANEQQGIANIAVDHTCPSCGTIYLVTFGSTITVEESVIPDIIFAISRYSTGVEVSLLWDRSKRRYVDTDTRRGWTEALDLAIGYCWRLYGEDIIKHIREEVS